MDKYLAMIPKNILAFLAITGGIAFIIFSQPPNSICDSQLEVINKSQRNFLYQDPKMKGVTTSAYERLRDYCKNANNPGGCYELFQGLKNMIHDLETFTSECVGAVGGVTEYKRALWQSADMMVRLAWGEAPPAAYTTKLGWLDTADISLFCKLKARVVIFYGQPEWEQFREKMMGELPGAKDLPRNQVWELSLFSVPCERYP
jgi:hypothetical protein